MTNEVEMLRVLVDVQLACWYQVGCIGAVGGVLLAFAVKRTRTALLIGWVLLGLVVPTVHAADPVRYYKLNDDCPITMVLQWVEGPGGGTLVGGDNTEDLHVPGILGTGALNLDGSADAIQLGSGLYTRSELEANGFTICFWFKGPVGGVSGKSLFSMGHMLKVNSWGDRLRVMCHYGGWGIGNGLSAGHPPSVYSDGTWKHIAWTWKPSTLQHHLYVDGVTDGGCVKNISDANIAGDPSCNWTINATTTPDQWHGGVYDDFRVYLQCMTSNEVKAVALEGEWTSGGSTNGASTNAAYDAWTAAAVGIVTQRIVTISENTDAILEALLFETATGQDTVADLMAASVDAMGNVNLNVMAASAAMSSGLAGLESAVSLVRLATSEGWAAEEARDNDVFERSEAWEQDVLDYLEWIRADGEDVLTYLEQDQRSSNIERNQYLAGIAADLENIDMNGVTVDIDDCTPIHVQVDASIVANRLRDVTYGEGSLYVNVKNGTSARVPIAGVDWLSTNAMISDAVWMEEGVEEALEDLTSASTNQAIDLVDGARDLVSLFFDVTPLDLARTATYEITVPWLGRWDNVWSGWESYPDDKVFIADWGKMDSSVLTVMRDVLKWGNLIIMGVLSAVVISKLF